MIDFGSAQYKTAHAQIEARRNKNDSWESIKNLDFIPGDSVEEKIETLAVFVEGITIESWLEICNNDEAEELLGVDTKIQLGNVVIPNTQNDFNYVLSESEGSAWNSYKQKLFAKGFDKQSIHDIQTASHKILNKLSLDTRESGPFKGLVIGNVQSGKTANMAGLISMAADQGWNMFIILSGTIENLRIQTQERLILDLESTNLSWSPIDNIKNGPDFIYALSKLKLNESSIERYLHVCLKNPTRLKNLLNWLDSDAKCREKLKILFIDDEADQAGINAAKQKNDDTEEQDRTKINRLLVNFFTNKTGETKKGMITEAKSRFKALDYVAYTATPYANILNEKPGIESMYPQNFVACLSTPNTYFGPQHIFGLEGTDYDGMNIINIIDKKEYDEEIKKIYDKPSYNLPKDLENSILWFYCCLATQRVKKYKKPVSMLVHTSQRTENHQTVAESIEKWIKSMNVVNFVDKCRSVYEEQIKCFTKKDFYEAYPNYGNKNIDDYLPFKDISNEIVSIFNNQISKIKIDEKGEFKFSKGVHLCVDNCKAKPTSEDEFIRLIYPSSRDNIDYATGFIVVGGATLSRGLTIEGLVSTYFLRTIKQADTLMQMGRWFGYRKSYELLPRIWMSIGTYNQFKFLSQLDYELREEMRKMQDNGISPASVGIRIRSNPRRGFLEISSKNKMKEAMKISASFNGLATQTTIFHSDKKILLDNYNNTVEFITKLSTPDDLSSRVKSENSLVWTGVDNDVVIDYISKMNYPRNDIAFLDPKLFKSWYEKMVELNGLNDWNVVVSGLDNPNMNQIVDINGNRLCKVTRSKKKTDFDDGYIRIGALRAPKDLYMDISIDNPGLDQNDIEKVKKSTSKNYLEIREHAGLSKTSLLTIYIIDKDSEPRNGENNRIKMNTPVDVVGLSIVIPNIPGENEGTYLSIDVSNVENDMWEVDVTDED